MVKDKMETNICVLVSFGSTNLINITAIMIKIIPPITLNTKLEHKIVPSSCS